MSNDPGRSRPNVVQYIAYCYGWVLPDSMTSRTIIRFAIPAILVLAPFWLIPTTLYLHVSMTLPIFLPYVMFTHALSRAWRRHRTLPSPVLTSHRRTRPSPQRTGQANATKS